MYSRSPERGEAFKERWGIPESTTEQDRIFVSAQMRGHRTVAVTTDGVDLVGSGIRQATVETLYERPALGLRFADSVTLTPDKRSGSVEYDFAEGDTALSYRVIHTLENGLKRETPWTTTTGDAIAAVARAASTSVLALGGLSEPEVASYLAFGGDSRSVRGGAWAQRVPRPSVCVMR